MGAPLNLFTKYFWADATERAISTAAQAALLVLPAAGLNVLALDWKILVGFAAGGALLSYIKSVAAALQTGTPSGSLLE